MFAFWGNSMVEGVIEMIQLADRQEIVVQDQVLTITNPTKPVWPKKGLSKLDYLQYLIEIADFMLPFLTQRALTVIRYPHGAGGESFFQKNCPSYAPEFIKTAEQDGINYIICSDLPTLLWLGNQLALEMHIPFNKVASDFPEEIVFDLDPPTRQEFSLAVEAALMIKEVTDKLALTTFIKTSGNKGLQIYIPLPSETLSYQQTRIFTQFIADYLVSKQPKWFTTERLKAKRGKRLYVDYVQHAPGKTIIAPYSVRGNDEALVATPLFWDELKASDLRPEWFPLDCILERLREKGCPFEQYFQMKKDRQIITIIDWLETEKSH